jgi:hypothetical protein
MNARRPGEIVVYNEAEQIDFGLLQERRGRPARTASTATSAACGWAATTPTPATSPVSVTSAPA